MWKSDRDEGFGKSYQFFYVTLRSGSSEDIQIMFARMARERRNILKSIFQLIYFMRGAVQYPDAMNMSLIERQLAIEFIDNRLDAERGKMYPIY